MSNIKNVFKYKFKKASNVSCRCYDECPKRSNTFQLFTKTWMANAKVSFQKDLSTIDQNFQILLREFLGLPNTGEEEAFPHENKTTNTGTIQKSTSQDS